MPRPAHPPVPLPPLLSTVPGLLAPALPAGLGQVLLALNFQYERSQWYSPAQLRELQLTQLRLVLAHAVAQVPWYADHARRANIDVARMTLEDFARWPFLRNEDVRDHEQALVARTLPPMHNSANWDVTTGSTGKPRRVLKTEAYGLHQMALVLRNFFWHGIDPRGKFMVVRAGDRAARTDQWSPGTASIIRTGPSVQLPTGESVPSICATLFAEAPAYLQGPPTLLKEVILESGTRRPPGLRALLIYAENMPPDLPSLARERWGVPVIESYSCVEFGMLALQCPEHGSLHVMDEAVYLEILREDGGACAPGESGRAVITTLNNFAMPLIRYEVGDMLHAAMPCACGRGLTPLGRLIGRVRHLLIDPQGKRYWPAIPGADDLRAIAPIHQMQYRQASPEEVDILYNMERDLTEGEQARLRDLVAEELSYPFRFRCVRSEGDLRSAGGKLEPAALRKDGGT